MSNNKRISELDNLGSGDIQDTDIVEVASPATTNYKFTWANIKAALKTYFDTLYTTITTFNSHISDFEDHNARHENGGADELSLAGLDGESVELASHKGVETSGVHGSTPLSMAGKLVHRDANGRIEIADGSASGDAVNKGQLDLKANDSAVLKKDGSVSPTADISMGGYKLTDLAAPISDSDAARKIDVDNARGIDLLAVSQQDTPDLTIQVSSGNVWFGSSLVEFAGGNSPSFTAPSSNPRIDVLSLNSAGTLIRTAGSEAGSPVAPSVPVGNIPICQVYNRVGQTSIKDADDSTNGYVYKDLRPVLTLGDITGFTASDNLVHSNDTSRETANATYTYTKIKECVMGADFTSVRVKFTLANPYNGVTVYARVYKNGVAIGTEREAGAALSEDFSDISKGDLMQIYAKQGGGGDGTQRAVVSNMRFYWDEKITHIGSRELETALPIVEIDNITNQDPT